MKEINRPLELFILFLILCFIIWPYFSLMEIMVTVDIVVPLLIAIFVQMKSSLLSYNTIVLLLLLSMLNTQNVSRHLCNY